MRKIAFTALLVLLSCGDGNGPSQPADDVTAEAWGLFEEGRYTEAAARFTEAIAQDPQWADAYNGRGWCELEQRELDASLQDFDSAIEFSGEIAQVVNEARTGQASVHNAGRAHADAAEAASAVIESDPSFVFSHRASIDVIDVRLTLCTALLGLARDEGDPAAVDSLFDEISGNLNAIDGEAPVYRDDPATWRLGDERFITFEEAVLEKLEWLISVYFG
jgi:tetratricopeptide (TPR) repeat protein